MYQEVPKTFVQPPSPTGTNEAPNRDGGVGYRQWLRSSNVKLFRDVLCKVLDTFDDVIAMQEDSGTVDIFNTLTKLRSNEWRSLQTALDSLDGSSPPERHLGNRESQVVISVLQSVVASLDSFILAMLSKIDAHINEVQFTARRQRHKLEEELEKVKSDFVDVRWRNGESKSLLRQAQHENLILRSELNEKTKRVRQLEKDANVKLWEKEKRKMVSRSQSKIEEQQKCIDMLQEDLQAKTELLRLQSLPPNLESSDADKLSGDVGTLRRHIRYLQKDLNLHAEELKRMQSNFASLINGFRVDFETYTDGLMEQRAEMSAANERSIHSLERRLREVEDFATSAPLSRLDSFPQHYQRPQEVREVALERLSEQFVLGSLAFISPRPSIAGAEQRKSLSVPAQGFSHESDTSSLMEMDDADDTISNPDLMNEQTKQINYDAVERHFPGLTREYVEEQWEQFCIFDKNKDYTLDLTEMMGAMSSTIGRYFSAREIKEAMLEADLDGSNTIDFYEYLNVVNMLRKKSDKPLAFESRLLQKQKNNLSRACVIQ